MPFAWIIGYPGPHICAKLIIIINRRYGLKRVFECQTLPIIYSTNKPLNNILHPIFIYFKEMEMTIQLLLPAYCVTCLWHHNYTHLQLGITLTRETQSKYPSVGRVRFFFIYLLGLDGLSVW